MKKAEEIDESALELAEETMKNAEETMKKAEEIDESALELAENALELAENAELAERALELAEETMQPRADVIFNNYLQFVESFKDDFNILFSNAEADAEAEGTLPLTSTHKEQVNDFLQLNGYDKESDLTEIVATLKVYHEYIFAHGLNYIKTGFKILSQTTDYDSILNNLFTLCDFVTLSQIFGGECTDPMDIQQPTTYPINDPLVMIPPYSPYSEPPPPVLTDVSDRTENLGDMDDTAATLSPPTTPYPKRFALNNPPTTPDSKRRNSANISNMLLQKLAEKLKAKKNSN